MSADDMPRAKAVLASGRTTFEIDEPVIFDISSMREIGLRPAPL